MTIAVGHPQCSMLADLLNNNHHNSFKPYFMMDSLAAMDGLIGGPARCLNRYVAYRTDPWLSIMQIPCSMNAIMNKRSPHGRRALDDALFKLPFGVVIADSDGHILTANDFFTSLTGYSLQEIQHTKLDGLLNGPLTDPLAVTQIALCLNDQTKFLGELLHYRKCGSTFIDHYSISPIFDSAGVLANFISLSQINAEWVTRQSPVKVLLSRDELDALFGSQWV